MYTTINKTFDRDTLHTLHAIQKKSTLLIGWNLKIILALNEHQKQLYLNWDALKKTSRNLLYG